MSFSRKTTLLLLFCSIGCGVMAASAQSVLAATEPKTITVVVPFAGADRETAVWAQQEDTIDFRRETEKAARCTSAYAAMELQHYLTETLRDTAVVFSAKRPQTGFFIELRMADPASRVEAWPQHKPNITCRNSLWVTPAHPN